MHKNVLQASCRLPSSSTEGQFTRDHLLNNAKHRHKHVSWYQHFDARLATDAIKSAEIFPSTCRIVFIHKKTTNNSEKYYKTLKMSLDGWDILVARPWSGTIWTSLLFSGAVALGYEEMDFVRTTRAIPVFPRDYPDTTVGTVQYSTVYH